MKNSQSVIALIERWEEFCEHTKKPSLGAFAEWLQLIESPQPNTLEGSLIPGTPTDSNAGVAAMLISRLNRMISLSNKPAIQKHGLLKAHELRVLIQVALSGRASKTEISRKALLEFSTTVEITKRLVKRGLINDIQNPLDRRSSILTLSSTGKTLLKNINAAMKPFYRDFLSCMSANEQSVFVMLLQRLEEFHGSKSQLQEPN
jgi:DNA-binding MarR family transcriptional regulator